MISKEIRVPYTEYSKLDKVPADIMDLIGLAKSAALNAYAPYSGFHVGVAIEMEDGSRFVSNNQENKAYPSGICAERVGIFFVQSNYPGLPVKKMVILALQDGELTTEPAFPCGSCRQVMVEAQERQPAPFEIWMAGESRILMVRSADDLLPLKFIL